MSVDDICLCLINSGRSFAEDFRRSRQSLAACTLEAGSTQMRTDVVSFSRNFPYAGHSKPYIRRRFWHSLESMRKVWKLWRHLIGEVVDNKQIMHKSMLKMLEMQSCIGFGNTYKTLGLQASFVALAMVT